MLPAALSYPAFCDYPFPEVVGIWNELQEEIVEACNITAAKRYLDRYMARKSLEGYWAKPRLLMGLA